MVVRHRAINLARSNGNTLRRTASDDQRLVAMRRDDDLFESAAQHEETRQLQNALARLPGAQAEVIALAYFGQLSHTEIAAQLGLPAGTVKARPGKAQSRHLHSRSLTLRERLRTPAISAAPVGSACLPGRCRDVARCASSSGTASVNSWSQSRRFDLKESSASSTHQRPALGLDRGRVGDVSAAKTSDRCVIRSDRIGRSASVWHVGTGH